jgi:hypothetical protein
MQHGSSTPSARGGITVLGLLLLIIAVVIAAAFLVRYLRSRPRVSVLTPAIEERSLGHQPFDQLNLTSVVEIVSGDTVNLLSVGPYPAG